MDVVPCTGTTSEGVDASLVMVREPLTEAVDVGVKLIVTLLLWPGASCIGVATAPKESPAPTKLTAVMSKFALPTLEI